MPVHRNQEFLFHYYISSKFIDSNVISLFEEDLLMKFLNSQSFFYL